MLTIDQINLEAEKEGWCISYTGKYEDAYNMYELQRIDEAGIFADDTLAILHVVALASNDTNSVHADAVRFLVQHSPNEIDSMFRGCCGSTVINNLLKKLNMQL